MSAEAERWADVDSNLDRQSEARLDSLPLLKELAASGVAVLDVSDLYNKRLNYRSAIPVLLKWLPRVSNPAIRQQIVAALGTRWARPTAIQALLDEFENADVNGLDRWRVGAALAKVVDDDAFDSVVAIVRNRRYGRARQELVIRLGEFRHPATLPILLELLHDPDVTGQAIIGLKKLGRSEAADAVRPFLTHPAAWVRAEARKALAKFEGAQKGPRIVKPRSNTPKQR